MRELTEKEKQDELEYNQYLDSFIRYCEDVMPEELKLAMGHINWAKDNLEEKPDMAREALVASVAALVCYAGRIKVEETRRIQNNAYKKFLDVVKGVRKD